MVTETNRAPDENDVRDQMERVALELIEGRGAHADPTACVEDLSATLAARKPVGSEHSVAELLAHINYWMDYDMKRMRGTPDPYPEHAAASWPEFAKLSDAEWKQILDRFRELLRQLEAVCRSDAAAWTKQAPAAHPSHERNISTVGGMIFQLIAHNSYHVGQIVDVRHAIGAWPPRGGGDTW